MKHRCSACFHSKENGRGIVVCGFTKMSGWLANSRFDCKQWSPSAPIYVPPKKIVRAVKVKRGRPTSSCCRCAQKYVALMPGVGKLCGDCFIKLIGERALDKKAEKV